MVATHEQRPYFAYGSNLNLAGMRVRASGAQRIGTARLRDRRLVFRRVADIEPAKGQVVEGAVYFMDADDWAAIDRYEGAPVFYERRIVVVEALGAVEVEAVTYVMSGEPRDITPPSAGYAASIMRGYSDWGLASASLDAALRRASAVGEGDRRQPRSAPR